MHNLFIEHLTVQVAIDIGTSRPSYHHLHAPLRTKHSYNNQLMQKSKYLEVNVGQLYKNSIKCINEKCTNRLAICNEYRPFFVPRLHIEGESEFLFSVREKENRTVF